jgi:hypothetical protein
LNTYESLADDSMRSSISDARTGALSASRATAATSTDIEYIAFMLFLLHLFHNQIILYGFYPFDAPYDFTYFIDGLSRINEAAQSNDALVSFNADLK